MIVKPFLLVTVRALALLCGLGVSASPACADQGARAWLVHCGAETCLRLSGHRPTTSTTIRVGDRELAVEGGRAWQATVPLATARGWKISGDYTLRLALIEPATGIEHGEEIMLPPGALGSRVELASLVVSAR